MNACRKMRCERVRHAKLHSRFLATFVRIALAITVIAPSTSTPTFSQESRGSETLEAKLDTRGTLMLRNATLADWAFAIKQEWGINIVSGVSLQNEVVDAGFEDTPLREILSEILFVRGYGYQAVGNSLRIVKLESLGAMRPGFETSILPLDLLQPSDVEPSVKMLTSAGATVQAVPSSRSLIVIDTPQQIAKIKTHIAALEANARKHARPGTSSSGASGDAAVDLEAGRKQTQVFQVQHLKVDELESMLRTVEPEGNYGVMVEENRLIATAAQDVIARIAGLLTKIDVPRQQVRITALLYDVDLEVVEQFGFNWNHAAKGRLNASGDPNSLFSFGSNNFAATPTASPLPGSAIVADTAATAATNGALGGLATLSSLSSHFDISAVIRVLDSTEGSRVLARPSVVASDRVEAVLQSVSEIPVQELTQTAEGGAIGTTNFREAGIILTVTPQVMQDGTIVMSVRPEFSVLAGFQSGQPIIDRRSATTTVRIMSGQTTVIGGLLRRNEFEKQSGLPGLSKSKYFGALFRDHDTTVADSELLVFIKAEIIPMGQMDPPREEAAKMVANDILDQTPYASHGPITPYCGDPYCPYHHPRPWGSALPPSACSACVDGKHAITNQPEYYGPVAPGPEAIPAPESLPVPPPVTGPPTSGPAVSEGLSSPANSEGTTVVPPVVVDEARRRWDARQRTAIRRLPSVGTFSSAPAPPAATRIASTNTPVPAARSTPVRLPSRQAQPLSPSDIRSARSRSVQPSTSTATRLPPPQPQSEKKPWWKLF